MLIAAMLSLLLAQAAPPSPDARAKELTQRAGKEYAAGDFAKAIADFKEAYELKPTPGLLYNLGQTCKQAKEYRQAAFYFSQYLRNTGPDDPNRPKAEAVLKEMRLRADEEDARAKKQSTVPAAPPASIAKENVVPATPIASTAAEAPSSGPRIAGYSLLGVAAVAVGIGVYEGLHYKSLNNDLDARYKAQGAYYQRDASLLSDAVSAGHIANAMFIATVVLAGAGGFLVYRF